MLNHFFHLWIKSLKSWKFISKAFTNALKVEFIRGILPHKAYFNKTRENTGDLKEQFDQLFLMLQPYVKVSEQEH
jgi:hypothetical protein